MSSNAVKKRKISLEEEYTWRAGEDLLAAVEKLCKNHDIVMQNDVIGGDAPAKEIVSIKDEVRAAESLGDDLIQYISTLTEEIVSKKEERVRGLFDSLSPLLSLRSTGVLQSVLSYLDEEALYSLEEASVLVRSSSEAARQWDVLYNLRLEGRLSRDPGPHVDSDSDSDIDSVTTLPIDGQDGNSDERGRAFVRASRFAKETEKAADCHYDYKQEFDVNEPLIEVTCPHTSNCTDLLSSGDKGPLEHPWEEVFVRLALQGEENDDPNLLWEGFLPAFKTHNDEETELGSIPVNICLNHISMSLRECMNFIPWPYDISWDCLVASVEEQAGELLKDLLEEVAQDLRITIVGDCSHRYLEESMALIVATGGYFSTRNGRVYFHPRHGKDPHKTKFMDDSGNDHLYATRARIALDGTMHISVYNQNLTLRWEGFDL